MSKMRKIPLAMKKGMALLKETSQLPIKDNVLLQTDEYTFYCNTTTFEKVVSYAKSEDDETANRLLEKFFLETAQPVNLQGFCYKKDVNIKQMLKKN